MKLLVTVLQDYIDYENGACTTIYLDTVDIKESLPILQYSPAFTSPNNEIILGPRMTEAEQILVKALLGKRGIQERCHKSCLRIR